jgi:hypothetical protein
MRKFNTKAGFIEIISRQNFEKALNFFIEANLDYKQVNILIRLNASCILFKLIA